MVVLGVVQTALALMTIAPTMNEQFSALVGLAVVTNVVPYIMALSALPVILHAAGIHGRRYRVTTAIALVAMVYSLYAVYASGTDAVFGGMLVMALGFVIWGFVASRFARGSRAILGRAA
jgi:putrescine:ornithine antiporter